MEKGFSLIELIVSIAIFMIITSIVLYNYGSFNNDLIVSNLAYEVALEVRTAQVYGLSVLGSNNSFNAGYGVHFDTNDTKDFYLFIDTYGTGKLQNSQSDSSFSDICVPPSAGGECVEKVSFQSGVSIQKFCTTQDDESGCSTTGGSPNAGYPAALDISFKRPNPDAQVTLTSLDGVTTRQQYKDARIYLTSNDQQRQKIITVDQSGQISIQ